MSGHPLVEQVYLVDPGGSTLIYIEINVLHTCVLTVSIYGLMFRMPILSISHIVSNINIFMRSFGDSMTGYGIKDLSVSSEKLKKFGSPVNYAFLPMIGIQ